MAGNKGWLFFVSIGSAERIDFCKKGYTMRCEQQQGATVLPCQEKFNFRRLSARLARGHPRMQWSTLPPPPSPPFSSPSSASFVFRHFRFGGHQHSRLLSSVNFADHHKVDGEQCWAKPKFKSWNAIKNGWPKLTAYKLAGENRTNGKLLSTFAWPTIGNVTISCAITFFSVFACVCCYIARSDLWLYESIFKRRRKAVYLLLFYYVCVCDCSCIASSRFQSSPFSSSPCSSAAFLIEKMREAASKQPGKQTDWERERRTHIHSSAVCSGWWWWRQDLLYSAFKGDSSSDFDRHLFFCQHP